MRGCYALSSQGRDCGPKALNKPALGIALGNRVISRQSPESDRAASFPDFVASKFEIGHHLIRLALCGPAAQKRDMRPPYPPAFARRSISIFLAPLLAFVLTCVGRADDRAPGKPLLWRIGGEKPSYVFGTIHLSGPRETKLAPMTEKALNGCDSLLCGGVREQVAGHLFDGEPVEWHVVVERCDHVIAE